MRGLVIWTLLWSACLFARPGAGSKNPEDLEGVESQEASAGLDTAQDEPSGPLEDQNEQDYSSILETLKKLRVKADESREGPSADFDSVEGPDYGPPAIYSWGTGMADDSSDAATGGPADDNSVDSDIDTDSSPEFPKDILEDNGLHEWSGQIVGKIGIRGVSGSTWNLDPTLTEALSQCVLNVTNIDASQLEFDKAQESEALGSGRRLLSSLRSNTQSQFSLGYKIHLRTDQKDEDAERIVQALEKVQAPEFAASFKAKARELNKATAIDSMPNGALKFAVTARLVETPLVAPAPPDASATGLWGYVGLDDWGSHEYGTMRMHNEVSTSIKLVIEGQHFDALAGERSLFKAATLLALKKELRLDFGKHLEVELKPGAQAASPDWGGGSQLTENAITLTVSLRDVASSFDEDKLKGAMVKVVQDTTLVNQLCDLAGGSWCLGANIRLAELDTPPAPVDDLREPRSKMLLGIPNILEPYFN